MKMKRIASIILSLLLAVTLSAQSADSSKFAVLGLKLEEYYDAMKHESLSVQEAECDFLIETATDPDLRQYIAQHIYDHFSGSAVMGSENVAVHVFDKWFADGTLAMTTPDAYAEARTYADFNRRSLIGCRAPALELERPDGVAENIFGLASPSGISTDSTNSGHSSNKDSDGGRFSALFFYDADCPKCRLQIRLLNALFSKKNYPVDLYAVYVGDDRQRWTEILANEFVALFQSKFPDMPDVMVHHFWDPTLASDFQRKYGVTQTPRMFLIGPDGTIVGRGLDAVALETMLDGLFAPKEMVYGGRESEELFDGIFAAYEGKPQTGAVKGIADYIHDKTLLDGDTLMFKQLAGDYLYYLPTRNGEGFKEGLRYHIEKNILSQDKVWTTQDDSLKVVGFAQIMSDLLSKALPGTRISSIKVPGELYSAAHRRKSASHAVAVAGSMASDGPKVNQRNVIRKLSSLNGDENVIIFYTDGCEVCAAEKAAALELLSRSGDSALSNAERSKYKNLHVFMVNVDALMASDPSLASRLMDSFDLSSLPFIITTDRRGTILRRYLSLDF